MLMIEIFWIKPVAKMANLQVRFSAAVIKIETGKTDGGEVGNLPDLVPSAHDGSWFYLRPTMYDRYLMKNINDRDKVNQSMILIRKGIGLVFR